MSHSMHRVEVTLPGGLQRNGCIERQARFRPLTGRIEQALINSGCKLDRPTYVTAVLASALETIAGQPADVERVADLCVADRQYLMLRLAAMLDGEQMWLKVNCAYCGSPFDVEAQRCDLPVKEAGRDFPLVRLRLKERQIDVRVPTGADQQLTVEQSEEQAFQRLLRSCVCSVDGEPPGKEFVCSLSEPDIEMIDEALDEASPAVCNQLLVTCPECGRQQNAELDHYDLAGMNEHYFYNEVHALASHYHWSEAAILDLPRERRRLYLGLINRSAGISEQGSTA